MSYLKHTGALEAITERITRNKPIHKNVAFTQLQGLATNLRNAVEAIGKMHVTPNPTETKEAHIKRVSVAAGQLSTKVKDMQININNIAQQGIKDVNERISQKVNLVPDGHAAEIRQVFRSMKQSEQIKLLGQLAEENRGAELAAIVKVPALLSGVTPEIQARFHNFIVEKHAPEEWAEQNALMESMEAAFVASDVGKAVVAEYSDPLKLADIEKQEVLARQASEAFASTFNSEVQA